MARVRLSASADEDLIQIFLFGAVRFGEAHAERYVRRLHESFALIADFPGIGRARPEIAAGIRSWFEGAHVILYLARGDEVIISRILHQSRDIDHVHVPDA